MSVCKHCGGKLEIRNPSGYCDHLYYPDNCSTCRSPADTIDTLRAELATLKSKLEGAEKEEVISRKLWKEAEDRNALIVAESHEYFTNWKRAEAENEKLREALLLLKMPHGKDIGDDHCCHFLVEQIDQALALAPNSGEEKAI